MLTTREQRGQGNIAPLVLAVWFRYRGLSGILWLSAFLLTFSWRKRDGRGKAPAAFLIQQAIAEDHCLEGFYPLPP